MNKAILAIWFFVLIYFGYQGLITVAWEGDSLAYHIPIAKLIQQGKIFGPDPFSSYLYYYPAASETILAGMLQSGFPINLFNVVGWVLLFFLCRRLGGTTFAVAVTLVPSMVRLLPTQTADIWLAVFWTASWLALSKKHWSAGILLGLLSGTKYSGLMYAVPLVIFTWPQNVVNLGLGWFIGGGYWYVRNWLLVGNPVFPASFLSFEGDPSFKLLNWRSWMGVVQYPVKFGSALISEFLLWMAAPLAMVNKKVRGLVLLGSLNFIIYLILPSWPENILSDLRYLYPTLIPWVLAVFLTWPRLAKVLTLASAIAVLPQLNYHPKLFVLYLGLLSVWALKKNWDR